MIPIRTNTKQSMETIMSNSFQEETWSGKFGKEYTVRNTMELKQLDELYEKKYGVTRKKMNLDFVGGLDRQLKILEVGTNSGNQLAILQNMGFKNLYGIDINEYAVEIAKKRLNRINLIEGSATDIPFKDNFFDLVYTSGVLIHVSQNDLPKVIQEIYRCSKRFIWGFEYYSEKTEEIKYRDNTNLLWKSDFSNIFRKIFSSLKLIKEKKYKYIDSENIDVMYLLEKQI
jgi:pseudaminic acid biosynthesis-associated methylase